MIRIAISPRLAISTLPCTKNLLTYRLSIKNAGFAVTVRVVAARGD